MNTTFSNSEEMRRAAMPYIRPAWTPLTIAMMIIGFMIFWPLGLAMLAYILWGDRLDEFKERVNFRSTSKACDWGRSRSWQARTGNVAFDDWREGEIERLEEERRKLDEMRQDFDDYLRELRRARDQEEFDAFMKDRNSRPVSKNTGGSAPKRGKGMDKPSGPSLPEV